MSYLGMNCKIYNFDFLHTEPFEFQELKKTSCWLLPISGGADSVLVLHLLLSLHCKNPVLRTIYVLYLDHQASEISEFEEKKRLNVLNSHIQELNQAAFLNVHKIFLKRDVNRCSQLLKQSFERTGSLLRKKIIDIYVHKFCIDTIFWGHTLTDWYETSIMRLNRGTSTSALYPYLPVEKKDSYYLVYFLCFLSRDEVRKICMDFQISYWNDPSNKLPIARRNIVRQQVPLFDVSGLRRTAKNFSFEKQYFFQKKKNDLQQNVLPFLQIQKKYREYWFPFYQYEAYTEDKKKDLVHYLLKEIGLYPLSSSLKQRVLCFPFVYGVYVIEIENWSNVLYLVFRRGRSRIMKLEKRRNEILDSCVYIKGATNVTKKDKISLLYGHKSVKKIFSEMKFSRRQQQYICLCFGENDQLSTIKKIYLELLGLKNVYSS